MSNYLRNDDVVKWLYESPVDNRTGNKVVYGASWIATSDSMIGKRNEDWVRRELDWFWLGSNNLDDMEPPVPQAFQGCAGADNTVNSAYGHILLKQNSEGLSQLDEAIEAFLREGPGTRHSVAIISDRDIHNMATENGKTDFICTNALNFMLDDAGKLHLFAQMRSMDAVWGYRADYSMWESLQRYMVYTINKHLSDHSAIVKRTMDLDMIPPKYTAGEIMFQVANLHVYPRHFDLLEREAESIYEMEDRSQWKGETSA